MEPMKSNRIEEYKGPGKVWSAFGGWGLGGLVGGLVALPFRWHSLKTLLEGRPIQSAGMWFGTSVMVLASSVAGAIIGWNKAKNGEEQFRESQTQLALSESENSHLKQVVAIQESQQKRYTETVTSRHQNHASHAEVAHAEKDASAHAQHAL